MKRVRITSIVAPYGTVFESLRREYERRIVGRVVAGPDACGYYKVQFPSVPDGNTMEVHRSMLTSVR